MPIYVCIVECIEIIYKISSSDLRVKYYEYDIDTNTLLPQNSIKLKNLY